MAEANSIWADEENVRIVENEWKKGATASEIALKIGERGFKVSRNAVIGKAHRLKLDHNVVNKPENSKKTPKRKAAPRSIGKLPIKDRKFAFQHLIARQKKVKKAKTIKAEAIMIKEPDPSRRVLLRETKEGDCRAIIGYRNNILADAICCGEKAVMILYNGRKTHSPWCAYHHDKYTMEPKSSK